MPKSWCTIKKKEIANQIFLTFADSSCGNSVSNLLLSPNLHEEIKLQKCTKQLMKAREQGYLLNTWIEPMVVINSQPWGIVHWLLFKRLHVQTTYLFLQAFFEVLLFTRNANKVRNQVQITLNTDIISRITNDYNDGLWRKTMVKMSWTCKRKTMYMLVYKHVENDHTANH